jgi:fructokinase
LHVVSIGEVLWDVVGETEHLGGAPFNFAAHLKKLGHSVTFVSAVGEDERGQRILDRMSQMGLSTRYVRRASGYPTGVVTVSFEAGQPRYVIHRPAAYDFPHLSVTDFAELLSSPIDWVYFGTLLQMSRTARELTAKLLDSARGAHHFYDVNLREGCWEPSLVEELAARADVIKLNEEEVRRIDRRFAESHIPLETFCRDCARKFGLQGVCVTRGEQGCALLVGGEYVEAAGYPVHVADTVGAGDAFAAALLHGMVSGNGGDGERLDGEQSTKEKKAGWPVRRIADLANRVGALVASRPGAIPPWSVAEAEALQPQPKA